MAHESFAPFFDLDCCEYLVHVVDEASPAVMAGAVAEARGV